MKSNDTKTVLMQLGAKVAYFRTLTGISQADLAKRIHSNQSTVSRIECGKYKSLGIPLLVSISNAMDTDLSFILHLEEVGKERPEVSN